MAELQDSLHTHQQSAKTTGGKTLELLAPAGTFEAFRAALAAGADAIYCGLGSFNARRNAENFTLEDFTQATRLAHLAGSRVYVTINILIREDELVQALKLVYECACAGADAFIVQDWGLLNLIHELWPALELHLSTQANVHDPLGVKFAEQQGCKRVTISRELTLQELLACSQVGPDIEAFGHGAICICYSGECLLSSMQRGRSANRGLCRQPCRLPYILSDSQGKTCAVIDGSRLLSPRDYCSIDNICDLVRSGVRSLKIEGRMKAPDYVASVVETYRKVIDEYESSGEPLRASEEAHRTLARAFNRDFTNGYLFGVHDNSIMSYERGNNRGQLVGSVVKSQGKQITVKLTEPVFTGDLLEIRNPQSFQDYLTALVPQDTPSKADLNIRLSRPMPVGCAVRLIRSEEAMQKAKQFASREWPRKRKLDVRIKAKLGEPFTVELDTGDCKAYAKGFLVEPAKTRAVTENDLIEHVGRLGTSPFEAKTFSVEMDENVGMSFSAVHEVRAQAADALVQAILEPWETIKNNLHEPPQTIPSPKCSLRVREETESVTALELAVLANTPKKAKAAKDAGATTVIVPVEDLVLGSGSSTLRQKYNFNVTDEWPQNITPLFGEVARQRDHELFNETMNVSFNEVICGSVSWLSLAREKQVSSCWLWDTLPLHNHISFEVFEHRGATGVWLSPELEILEIERLAKLTNLPLGITAYGYIRTMTCEHCVLQAMGNCKQTCKTCPRRENPYALKDEFGRPSLVTTNALGRSNLWWNQPLDITPHIAELARIGVKRFLVDTRLLNEEESMQAINHVKEALEAVKQKVQLPSSFRNTTTGHLFERIG